MTPNELAVQWRKDAVLLERYGDDQLALVCQTHADELEAALRSQDDDALDLATASKVSGYSADRLRHKITAGEIPNAGKKGSPRIRRADLPMKGRAATGSFDAASVASNVLGR